jgi:hypothetical protein
MGVKIEKGFIRRIAMHMHQPNKPYIDATTNRQKALNTINTRLKESIDEESCVDDIFYIESQDLFVFKTAGGGKEGFLISFERLEIWREFRDEIFSACKYIIPQYNYHDWRSIIAAMILVAKRM